MSLSRNRKLTIAVAQCVASVCDVKANLVCARKLCARARKLGADVILFPECHATGYSYRTLRSLVRRTAEPADGPIANALRTMAKDHSVVVCCGMTERANGCFFNTHLVAFPDGRLERQRKGILNILEEPVFSAETRRCAFEWNGVTFGILVCADLTLPDYAGEFRKLGIQFVLNPSAGRLVGTSDDADHRLPLQHAEKLARKLKLPYVVANPCGFSGEDFYPGNSWIMNGKGETLVHLPAVTNPKQMKDSIGVATLEFAT